MKRSSGFTLIELMITLVVVAILVAIALPSYQAYVIRGVRSAGQQFLADLAQRQEQYFLDARQYAIGINTVPTANMMTISVPDTVAAKYQAPVFTVPAVVAGTPPTYVIRLSPIAGGLMAADGDLYINSIGQRWRETDGNGTFDTIAPTTNCLWENRSCSF